MRLGLRLNKKSGFKSLTTCLLSLFMAALACIPLANASSPDTSLDLDNTQIKGSTTYSCLSFGCAPDFTIPTSGSPTGRFDVAYPQAIDTTPGTTVFATNDPLASVKVVKYAANGSTNNFSTDSIYNDSALSTGDFFVVRVISGDHSTTSYYRFTINILLSSNRDLAIGAKIKGVSLTSSNYGSPVQSASLFASITAGSVTLTQAQASDTTGTIGHETVFQASNLYANIVNVVKYSSGSSFASFSASTPSYADQAISNGDFFIIGVSAQDLSTNYYKIVVTVSTPSLSNISSLTGISLNVGTLSPAFSSTVTSYTTYRPSTDTSISVTPTFTGTGESVKINGSPTASNSPVAVYVGSTRPATITLVATAQDNTTTTYTITVAAPATSYTFTGPNSGAVSTNSSNFTITPVDGGYNGTISIAVSGGGLSTTITKTFTNSSSAQTFIVTPTGVGTVTLTPTASPSLGTNPAALSYVSTAAKSLSIGTLSAAPQATVPSTSTYPVTTVSIADGQGVSISWFASDGTTSMSSPIGISISGSNVSSNASLLTVTTLNNSMAGNYYFKATSDGTTSALKTLTVSAAPVLATTSTLSGISLSAGTLSPAFSSTVTSYTTYRPSTDTAISVTPTFTGTGESVKINGSPTASNSAVGVYVGSTRPSTITLVATAQDNTTTTYTITVAAPATSYTFTGPNSGAVSTGSTNFAIAPVGGGYNGTISIAVSGGGLSSTITKTFTNSSAAQTFTITPTGVGTVTLTPTASPSLGTNPVALSYISTPAKSLSIGTISAAPQATVPSTSTYPVTTVSIADGQGVSISWFASDGTTLVSSPTGISISGSNVSSNASLLTVTTLNSSVAGNYYFKATSDGTTSALKTLIVAAAPVLATTSTLSGISIFGTTLSPAFNSSTASYTATVDNSVASISVTPSFLGTGETSTVNGVQTTSGTSSSLINLAVGTNTITVVGTAQDGSTTTYTITVTRSVSSGNGTPAPAPDPVQTNSINNGSTTVSGPIGGGDCTINGNFGSAVTNVSIDGTLLPKTSWNQTSSSVTINMPPHDEGTVSIQIFDGQAPLLTPVTYKYLSNPSATSAPSTNSPAGSSSTSGTSTSAGNGAATPTPTPSANPTPPAKSDSATSTSTPSAKKEKAVLSYSYNSAKTTGDIKTFLSTLAITPTSKISIAGYAQPTAPSDDLRISKDRAMKLKEAILALYPKVQVEVSANGSKKEALCENSSNRCAVVTILKK